MRPRSVATGLALALALGAVVLGCGLAGGPTANVTPLTVGLGYIPSVQFAPFYLAQQAGYYRAEGLEVSFQNKIDPDLVALVGTGAVDVGIADGTSVIPAVSQGIPIRYLATVYGTNPSIVFARESSGIAGPADLAGRTIGIPGRYGSSWIVLQAILGVADLTVDDVEIVEYPDFGQGVAVREGAVDAATGFANNEPVALELGGENAVVIHVESAIALPGPGLISGTSTVEAKHDALAGFVRATLRAMNEIVDESDRGLDAAIAAVPELGQDRAAQSAILRATIEVWTGPLTGSRGLGAIDRDGWADSIEYMKTLDLVPNPVTVDQLVDESLLPAPD
ncbi:MAG TPA: ABC transporter substrate-binding protein [Candidatus Limnocylindrales bacterium]